MRKLVSATLMLVTMATAGWAQANARTVTETLQYSNNHYRGVSEITLRKDLISQHGYTNRQLDKFNLKTVKLIAKSALGGGDALLYVGSYKQDYWKVPAGKLKRRNDKKGKDGWRFKNNRRESYNGETLTNGRYEKGSWKIELRGNIKVRKVVLTMKRKRDRNDDRNDDRDDWDDNDWDRPGRGEFIELGSVDKLPKGVIHEQTFYPSRRVMRKGIKAVAIEGTRGTAIIESVIVSYADGYDEYLTRLEGSLYDGEMTKQRVQGRVRAITVRANSSLFGSRGSYKLSVKTGGRR